MPRRFWMLCILFITAWAVSCTSQSAVDTPIEVIATLPSAPAEDLIDVLSSDPQLVLFVNALSTAGVLPALDGAGPFTVLAPTNDAFTRMGLATSQIDAAALQAMVGYHVIPGDLTVAEAISAVSAPTLQGEAVTFSQDGSETQINYALVLQADILAANGVVHVIDAVLIPANADAVQKSVWETLVADGRFSQLAALMGGNRVMYSLHFDNFADAFVAPTDEAFAKLPPGTLENLLQTEEDADYLFNYWVLAPGGWPRGTPLALVDILEMGLVETHTTRQAEQPGTVGFIGFEELEAAGTIEAMTLGGAKVVEGDIAATNGIIHAIDTVLIPPALADHIEP